MMAQLAETNESPIWNVLNRNLFFVKDAVKRSEWKTSDKLDLYDPATRQLLIECREPHIGFLTKMARACGGHYDHGSSFDLVGGFPGGTGQGFRIKRGYDALGLGVPTQFFDHQNQLIGTMKKKRLTWGLKFTFFSGQAEIFVLQIKFGFLSSDCELLMEDKPVARVVQKWKSDHSDFFKEGKFSHAISITPDYPVDSPARQLLLAFCAAIHRVNR